MGNTITGAATYYDNVTLKYGPQGRLLWLARHDVKGYEYSYDAGYAETVDAKGNVYVACSTKPYIG